MGTATFSNNGNYYIDVDAAVVSQNQAGNYSTIYWRVIVTKTSGTGFWSNANANNSGWANQYPAGTRVWTQGSLAFDFRGGTPKSIQFADGTFNVYHDADGYATYAVDAAVALVNLGSAYAASGNKSAPRIPKLPGAPTPVGVDQITDTSLRYRFSGTTDGGASITGWQAQIATNPGFTTGVQTVSSSGTTAFTGLNPHTTYYLRSRGSNFLGWGPYSTTTTTATLGQPTAPTGLAATPSTSVTGRIALTWGAPATPGAGGVTGYNIFRDGVQIATTTGTGTGYTDSGRTPYTSYQYSVAARNAYSATVGGTGPRSAAVSAVAPGPPTAPRNLSAVSSPTIPGQVTLSWTAPVSGGAGGVTQYRVYRSEGQLVGTTASTSYTVGNLNPGSNYTFMVAAVNALATAEGTQSAYSNYASVTPIGEPGAPTGLTATPSTSVARRLVLNWTAPAGSLSGFSIFRRTNGQDTLIATIPSGATRFPVDGLTAGVPVSFVVRARTAYTDTLSTGYPGNWGGPASNAATGTPQADYVQAVPSLAAAQSQTNAAFNGTYAINAATATSFGFLKNASDIPEASVAGTATNNTNAVLNGSYTISSASASSFSYTKAGTAFTARGTSGGSLTNTTNIDLSGTYTVVTVNAGANLFTYADTGADISSRAVPVNAAPGKSSQVVNKSNSTYNSTGKTISSITEYTLTYAQTGANQAETNAAGVVLDLTNRDTYNGTYTVSAIPAYNVVRYGRTASNIAKRVWTTLNGIVRRTVSPAKLDVKYRSGWAG